MPKNIILREILQLICEKKHTLNVYAVTVFLCKQLLVIERHSREPKAKRQKQQPTMRTEYHAAVLWRSKECRDALCGVGHCHVPIAPLHFTTDNHWDLALGHHGHVVLETQLMVVALALIN